MGTVAPPSSSAGFDFTQLVERALADAGVSLSLFARLRLRSMQMRADRHRKQSGAWLDETKAQASVGRLVNALLALQRPKISVGALGEVLGFLCPGLYPIC